MERVLEVDDRASRFNHGILLVVLNELCQRGEGRSSANVKDSFSVPDDDVRDALFNASREHVEARVVHRGTHQVAAVLTLREEQRLCLATRQTAVVPPVRGGGGGGEV